MGHSDVTDVCFTALPNLYSGTACYYGHLLLSDHWSTLQHPRTMNLTRKESQEEHLSVDPLSYPESQTERERELNRGVCVCVSATTFSSLLSPLLRKMRCSWYLHFQRLSSPPLVSRGLTARGSGAPLKTLGCRAMLGSVGKAEILRMHSFG